MRGSVLVGKSPLGEGVVEVLEGLIIKVLEGLVGVVLNRLIIKVFYPPVLFSLLATVL